MIDDLLVPLEQSSGADVGVVVHEIATRDDLDGVLQCATL